MELVGLLFLGGMVSVYGGVCVFGSAWVVAGFALFLSVSVSNPGFRRYKKII